MIQICCFDHEFGKQMPNHILKFTIRIINVLSKKLCTFMMWVVDSRFATFMVRIVGGRFTLLPS
jgi:hypothetical protein